METMDTFGIGLGNFAYKCESKHTKCDNCGYDMTDENGMTVIGVCFSYPGDSKQEIRFRKMFGKPTLNFCFCCWAKSMGAKPIEGEDASTE